MGVLIFSRSILLIFQSHQMCTFSENLGIARNRDGLSCNDNKNICNGFLNFHQKLYFRNVPEREKELLKDDASIPLYKLLDVNGAYIQPVS